MPRHISKKVVYETPYFKVSDVDIEFSSGTKRTFKVIEKGDTAMIVPIDSDRNVLLIREYMYAANEFQIALPKGMIEKGHDSLTTANKELQEETGFKANQLDELGVLTMSPAYLTQKTHVFLARDLEDSRLKGDEDEKIEVLPTPFGKVDEMIEKGEINEARVIAAIFLAKNFLNKHQ